MLHYCREERNTIVVYKEGIQVHICAHHTERYIRGVWIHIIPLCTRLSPSPVREDSLAIEIHCINIQKGATGSYDLRAILRARRRAAVHAARRPSVFIISGMFELVAHGQRHSVQSCRVLFVSVFSTFRTSWLQKKKTAEKSRTQKTKTAGIFITIYI